MLKARCLHHTPGVSSNSLFPMEHHPQTANVPCALSASICQFLLKGLVGKGWKREESVSLCSAPTQHHLQGATASGVAGGGSPRACEDEGWTEGLAPGTAKRKWPQVDQPGHHQKYQGGIRASVCTCTDLGECSPSPVPPTTLGRAAGSAQHSQAVLLAAPKALKTK